MHSRRLIQQARNRIFEQPMSLNVRRAAWFLYQHELQRPNNPFTPARVLANVLAWMQEQDQTQKNRLSKRELRFLYLLAHDGQTMKQIAFNEGISETTVKAIFRRMRRRFGNISLYQFVAISVERGWVPVMQPRDI